MEKSTEFLNRKCTNRTLDLRKEMLERCRQEPKPGDRTRAGHNSPCACVETLPRALNDIIQRRIGTKRCRTCA